MRLLADEHVPTAFMSALAGEGHDVAAVGDGIALSADDRVLLEYARETDRVILSQDTDFRGADPELNDEPQPGVLACDPTAKPGEIATAVRRIDAVADDLSETVLYVSGDWC